MKKSRYTIAVDIYDGTLQTTEIEISKAEYYRQREYLEAQALADEHNHDDEFFICHIEKSRSYDKMQVFESVYRNGASDIILTEYRCKEGYAFTPKGRTSK